jgi:hypothetical protein
MKSLEEEADKYFSTDNGLYTSYSVKNKEDKFTSVVSKVRAVEFVKESKWVQAEKIKAQIEVLEAILNKYIDESLSGFYIRGMISDLQQQLKQLEDETDTN